MLAAGWEYCENCCKWYSFVHAKNGVGYYLDVQILRQTKVTAHFKIRQLLLFACDL